MAKAYCECLNPTGWRPLWNPYTEDWVADIFVCGDCTKPSREVWVAFLGTCENCYRDFSFPETIYSPWGPLSVAASPEHEGLYLCAKCTRTGAGSELQPPYRGWKWAGKQAPDWHPGYIGQTSPLEFVEIGHKPLDNLVGTL